MVEVHSFIHSFIHSFPRFVVQNVKRVISRKASRQSRFAGLEEMTSSFKETFLVNSAAFHFNNNTFPTNTKQVGLGVFIVMETIPFIAFSVNTFDCRLGRVTRYDNNPVDGVRWEQ